MQTFNRGDSVYTENGQMCEYVAKVDGKHIVMPMYEYPDGGGFTGEPFSTAAVFITDDAVKTKLSKQVDELDAKLRAKREQLVSMEAKATQLQREQNTILAKLKEHTVLKNIEDFLAGRITHFLVVTETSAKVSTLVEELEYKENDYDRHKCFRLLSLYGDSKGDISWKVGSYRDGSGNQALVTPFCNSEDAITARDAYLRDRVNVALQLMSPTKGVEYQLVYRIHCLVKAMIAYGIKDIPEKAMEIYWQRVAEDKNRRMTEVTAKLNAAKAELKALQDGGK